MTTDGELLRQYAHHGAESAFTALVERHLNLVYRTALRRVGGNRHAADDVTQRVFIGLARKASALAGRESLAGWLYTSARFASAELVRGEQRRRKHETAAQSMSDNEATEPPAEQIDGLLDDVIAKLSPRDQEILVLHFFEGRTFAEVGAELSSKPDACRMRLNRSLDKMRAELSRRGLTSAGAALAAVLSAHAAVVPGLPVAATVAAQAIAGAAAGATGGVAAAGKVVTGLKVGSLFLAGIVVVAGLFALATIRTAEETLTVAESYSANVTEDEKLSSEAPTRLVQPNSSVAVGSSPTPATSTVAPSARFSELTAEERNLLAFLWRAKTQMPVNALPGLYVGVKGPNSPGVDRLAAKAWIHEVESDRSGQRKIRLTVAGLRYCRRNQVEIEAFAPRGNLRRAEASEPAGK